MERKTTDKFTCAMNHILKKAKDYCRQILHHILHNNTFCKTTFSKATPCP